MEPKPGTYSYEIERSRSRAHADFPKLGPFGRIYVDVGQRKSTCFACHQAILKGTPRFVILALRPRLLKFRNGGMSNHVKSYAHVTCVRQLMKGVKVIDGHRQCVGCTKPVHPLSIRASTSRTGEWGWLCSTCLDGGMFVQCVQCKVHYPKGMCSYSIGEIPVLLDFDANDDEYHPAESIICDCCTANYGIRTLKSQKRREDADKRFESRLQGAIAQLSDWLPGRVRDAEGTGTARKHQRQG